MAYSMWRHEKQMSLKEKKTAWSVLEAFPSYKAKMKLKEKFSIRLIRKTYKWLIKVNELKKETGKVTISQFMDFGCEGCSIFLEDAFEIEHPPEREDSDLSSNPEVNDGKDPYDSCSSGENEEFTNEEMNDFFKLMGQKPGNSNANINQSANGLGQMMGGMLGGMMQGLVGGMVGGKDSVLYEMYEVKHKKLKEHLEKNYDNLSVKERTDYTKMLKILSEVIESYDKYDGNALGLTQFLDRVKKRFEAIDTPYPAEEVGFDEEGYSQALLSGMFSQNNAQTEQPAECSVM